LLGYIIDDLNPINEIEPVNYALLDGVIHISTERLLKQRTLIRCYPLRGIVEPSNEEAVQNLTSFIAGSCGRVADWASYGGELYSIVNVDGLLLVRATWEVHMQVEDVLRGIYRMKQALSVDRESPWKQASR
jgi:hypothetical protein